MELNPGIRLTVAALNAAGFETTDSGDGKTHDYECDRPYPYVVIHAEPSELVAKADQLLEYLKAAHNVIVGPISPGDDSDWCEGIQADYDPANQSATISLMGYDDKRLGLVS